MCGLCGRRERNYVHKVNPMSEAQEVFGWLQGTWGGDRSGFMKVLGTVRVIDISA